MKEIVREKIQTIKVQPGDSITLSYSKEIKGVLGNLLSKKTERVLWAEIKKEYTFDEAVIFDVEEGDFEGAEDGIGGAFLGCEKSLA